MADDLFDPDLPPILHFRGPWAFLSNFAPAVLRWPVLSAGYRDPDGVVVDTVPTSEHAFNLEKSTEPQIRLWVAGTKEFDASGRCVGFTPTTAREAKRRGGSRRHVQLRPDWDSRVRHEVMDAVLRAKFLCHPVRTQALLSTGHRLLVETTTWHDNVWGNCVCGRPACAVEGQNFLGKALMRLRAQARGV